MKFMRSLTVPCLLAIAGISQAALFNVNASLTGSQEVPPNNSTATGTMVGLYDDATNIITVTSFNLVGMSSALSGSHIHVGNPGSNGGVIVNIPVATSWMNMGSGNYMYQGTSLTLPQANEAAFLTGGTYFNIHTSNFPGGEIRGQIIVTPVPEPATMMALAAGVGFMLRRRRSN